MSSKIPLWECSLNVFVIVIVFVFAGLCRSAHGNLRFQESQLALGPVFKLPPKRIPGFQDLQKKQSLYCSYCIKTNNQQKITMITNTNSNKKKHVLKPEISECNCLHVSTNQLPCPLANNADREPLRPGRAVSVANIQAWRCDVLRHHPGIVDLSIPVLGQLAQRKRWQREFWRRRQGDRRNHGPFKIAENTQYWYLDECFLETSLKTQNYKKKTWRNASWEFSPSSGLSLIQQNSPPQIHES